MGRPGRTGLGHDAAATGNLLAGLVLPSPGEARAEEVAGITHVHLDARVAAAGAATPARARGAQPVRRDDHRADHADDRPAGPPGGGHVDDHGPVVHEHHHDAVDHDDDPGHDHHDGGDPGAARVPARAHRHHARRRGVGLYLAIAPAGQYEAPALVAADQAARAAGYGPTGAGELACDRGAADALGADPTSLAAVVYVETEAQADQARAGFEARSYLASGVAEVVTGCLD